MHSGAGETNGGDDWWCTARQDFSQGLMACLVGGSGWSKGPVVGAGRGGKYLWPKEQGLQAANTCTYQPIPLLPSHSVLPNIIIMSNCAKIVHKHKHIPTHSSFTISPHSSQHKHQSKRKAVRCQMSYCTFSYRVVNRFSDGSGA